MTDRIDFSMLADTSVIVQKLRRVPEQRRDIPITTEIKEPGFSLDDALRWCEENDFTVLWWYDVDGRKCARAFRGEPWPVRSAWRIARLRERLNDVWSAQFHKNPGKHWPIERMMSMDLAFAG